MTSIATAEKQIRHARWLLDQAAPLIVNLTTCSAALSDAQKILLTLAGDYREDEKEFFERFAPAHYPVSV